MLAIDNLITKDIKVRIIDVFTGRREEKEIIEFCKEKKIPIIDQLWKNADDIVAEVKDRLAV